MNLNEENSIHIWNLYKKKIHYETQNLQETKTLIITTTKGRHEKKAVTQHY